MRGNSPYFQPVSPRKFRATSANNCLLPTGTRPGAFRIIRIIPATPAKHVGDFVAQRELIRNGPATPESMSLLECCGVADKTVCGSCPARGNWTLPRAALRTHVHIKIFSLKMLTPEARGCYRADVDYGDERSRSTPSTRITNEQGGSGAYIDDRGGCLLTSTAERQAYPKRECSHQFSDGNSTGSSVAF